MPIFFGFFGFLSVLIFGGDGAFAGALINFSFQ